VARTWTYDQAASLAPDAASLKAGQGHSAPRKWSSLGTDGTLIWGLAQGSGAEPYQSQVDLSEPAFKCSCPSRKFPCKHGLGLLLLYASHPSVCPTQSRPAWVEEWLAKRTERAAKAVAKAESTPPAPADPAAQGKRREKREKNIQEGVAFLEGWLRDLVRQGLTTAAAPGYGFWDATARRMVDAQAPGLARRVRALASVINRPSTPEALVYAELGRLHLLLAAYSRRHDLSAEWRAELESQIGWTTDQDELKAQPGTSSGWYIAAQTLQEEDRLITRTSYLFSHDGRPAKVLEFTHATQAAVSALALGRWVQAELVFFPGVAPLRAVLKSPPHDLAGQPPSALWRCEEVLSAYAARLALTPLSEALPVLVQLIPERRGERWWLRDEDGGALPIARNFSQGWELLACSGGSRIELCGTWNGVELTPLSLIQENGAIALTASSL